jgi:dihydroorotate dehydrogenase
MTDLFTLTRPLLHCMDAEAAHHLALRALSLGLVPAPRLRAPSPALSQTLFGLSFANPVGLAAGFDKNAVAVNALLRQGFGFVEAGTVTPLAQPGNPKPRMFRLSEDRAVINRLGFNNEGLEHFTRNFAGRDAKLGIAGANIGKNKDQTDAVADYVRGLEAVYALADYVTINISSPNTQGLRDLQHEEALGALLGALRAKAAELHASTGKHTPLLLKIAPDIDADARAAIASVISTHPIDALIVSNTTISRPEHLQSPHRAQTGGLSGAPLMALSTQVLADMYRLTKGSLPLIGVGGIASPADAYAKIRAGASLVQLYSALAYQGFALVRRMVDELPALLARDGFTHIREAIGADAR